MYFLIFLGLAIVIGLAESAKDSYDAYQFKKSGGLEAKYPGTFGKKNDKK